MSTIESTYIPNKKMKCDAIRDVLFERLTDDPKKQINHSCLFGNRRQDETNVIAESFIAANGKTYATISKNGHILYRHVLDEANLPDVYDEMAKFIIILLKCENHQNTVKVKAYAVDDHVQQCLGEVTLDMDLPRKGMTLPQKHLLAAFTASFFEDVKNNDGSGNTYIISIVPSDESLCPEYWSMKTGHGCYAFTPMLDGDTEEGKNVSRIYGCECLQRIVTKYIKNKN